MVVDPNNMLVTIIGEEQLSILELLGLLIWSYLESKIQYFFWVKRYKGFKNLGK